MTLDNLIGTQLEAVEPDRAGVERLLDAAHRSLTDAALLDLSNEGRFDMAHLLLISPEKSKPQSIAPLWRCGQVVDYKYNN
ncbi:MAG TPA: hypothetical protein VMV35_04400 [Halothiobacillus sp.]|nr:hypothetical protein [Halothiobacillus sp.]